MTTSTDTSWQNLVGLEEIPPVTKLDADQYDAEDLNGHTDTAAGTGSLNYALLQSAITRDAQAIAADGIAPDQYDGAVEEGDTKPNTARYSTIASDNAGAESAPVTAHAGENPVSGYSYGDTSIGHFQSQTASTTPQSSSHTTTSGAVSNGAASNGAAGHNGSNGQDGTNGNQVTKIVGADGEDGDDGSDGQDGDGGTVNNTYNTYKGDTVNNSYHSETTQSVSNNYYSTVENYNSTTTINNSSTTVIDNSVVNNTVNNTTNNDDHSVTLITINHGGHHHDHDHNPPSDPDDTPQDHDVSLDLLGHDIGLILNTVENLLGDIDLGGGTNIDPFNTGSISNSAGDTDIVFGSGLEGLSGPLGSIVAGITLDAVEAITGDIDINLTAALDGLGAAAPGLIDTLGGGTGISRSIPAKRAARKSRISPASMNRPACAPMSRGQPLSSRPTSSARSPSTRRCFSAASMLAK